jgi:hypothetical protein
MIKVKYATTKELNMNVYYNPVLNVIGLAPPEWGYVLYKDYTYCNQILSRSLTLLYMEKAVIRTTAWIDLGPL